MATNAPAAGAGSFAPGGDPAVIEREYDGLMALDDAALAETAKWKLENDDLKGRGAGVSDDALARRIRERLKLVDQAYRDFLGRHPGHARALLAYGCFLNDREDETGAQVQWEKVLELDPGNADAYNNLAGRYSESGPVGKAFEYYDKAIGLNPSNAVYYHNFANALYVLRNAAATHYRISEPLVFAKVLLLQSNAARLEPKNLGYATDLAETYYSVKPFPAGDALRAWTNALARAATDFEREVVYVDLARVKMLAGFLAEARSQLAAVTNATLLKQKSNLLRRIDEREKEPGASKAAPGAALPPSGPQR